MIIDKDIFNLLEAQPEPQAGDIIIAEPFLVDPFFSRSCVLLTKHSEEIDSMGFVINNKLDCSLTDIFPDIETSVDIPMFLGGPMSTDRLFFIHDFDYAIPGATPIVEGISMCGDFGVVKEILTSQPESSLHFKFFIGYSGWSKGQLAEELSNHTWAVGKTIPHKLIMTVDTDDLWRGCVASLGDKYKNWLACPDSPSLN